MANRNRCLVNIFLSLLVCGGFFSSTRVWGQTNSPGVERAFARATQLHESGKLEEAIRAYQEILATHPDRVDVRSNLGAAYSGLGRYESAIEQYRRALALENHNQTIRYNLALAYYKSASFAEAAGELTRFIAGTSASVAERPNAILLLADCQVRMGEYKRVIELLSPLSEKDPENSKIAYLLGSALIGDDQLRSGQLLLDRVFRGDDSAEARLLMGSILLLADDGQGAIKELERGIELNSQLPALHAWYGRALMRMGDTEKAKIAFRSELASNPNDFDANLHLGILLRQDKLFEDSFAVLSHAVQLRPREQFARYHLSAVLAALGKPNEARVLLEGVLKEHPDFVEAHVLLASMYYRLNRKEDGNRERATVQKLNAEQQAKQPGSQDGTDHIAPAKAPY